jgi:hypothetical protein
MKLLSILFILFFSFSVFGQADTTAPNVTYLRFSPYIVNLGTGDQTVTVGVHANDDISGVSNIRVRLRSPSGSQMIDIDLGSEQLVSGNPKNGFYTKSVTFLQTIEQGYWIVEYVHARDKADNEKYLPTSEMPALGLSTRLEVIACVYTLGSQSQDFPASGGSGVATATTSGDCPGYTIPTGSFIVSNSIGGSIFFGSNILNIRVPFVVPANTGAARSGTLNIGGQIFTVNQSAATSKKRTRIFLN